VATRPLNHRLAADLDVAFPDLVDTYGPMVLSIARQVGDPTEADDLSQKVFVAAYRALGRYDTDQLSTLALRPWLVTITRNQLRNERRRRSRKPTSYLTGSDPPVTRCEADTTIEAMRLEAALGLLTEPQRLAVVLRHVAGLSTNETAQVMACPPGTVKSHVSRGLAALREALTERSISEEARP
jgi:RNA polymerase sigma factor (sigma-70 family)